MARRLPSLNALRAFEAAARHLSFTWAADELHVTQAAVSHQIKTLEEQLGMPLFRRMNRALLLTDAGQELFPAVGAALDGVAQAVDRLHRHEEAGVLTVTTMASFAAAWLVPRLGRFRRLHPDIDVRLTISDLPVNFTQDNVDLGLRYGQGHWPGLATIRLMTEEVYPVCSPALIADGPALEKPEDLGRYTLLHDDMREDWRMWLMASGADGVDDKAGPSFQHSNLVIQAAIAGEGIALGRSVMVEDEIKAGRLVRPFDLALPASYAYYMVCPKSNLNRSKIKAFRSWLQAEVAA